MTSSYGYKRPPEHSRFKPGQSGNPKGRKKKNRVDYSLQELEDFLHAPSIKASENGRSKKISLLDLMLKRLRTNALRTDLTPKQAAEFLKVYNLFFSVLEDHKRRKPLSIPTVLRLIGPDARL